jgi:hypothetical protein
MGLGPHDMERRLTDQSHVDGVNHKGVSRALNTFAICIRTKNLLCEAGLVKLDEIRKLNSTNAVTNADYPIRPYFMNPNKLGEYAMWPRDPQPLFVRTAEYLGETQIDIMKKEMASRYDRPPWKPVNKKQFEVGLSAFRPRISRERYMTEMARTLHEDYEKHVKIYTHRSKMGDKVGYVIVKEEHTIEKRILPQNTVFSAEQSAIIKAIQSETNNRHEIVIITDSLSMIMAAENRTPTKNSKTQTIRKMLDHEGLRITLLWVPPQSQRNAR